MLRRSVLTLVNFATIGVAIAVLIFFPQYSAIAFYVLLGWMVGSLALVYSPWASRPIGGGAPPGPASADTTPLSAATGHVHSSTIGFCMYCAAPIEPGTARCPACHRALPHFS
ncbi:MAG TPA: hypothetical protein VMF04_01635 [Thermoplasmata archaeon]|nr:hypothetical protein [Thermoplasmata archaeon]